MRLVRVIAAVLDIAFLTFLAGFGAYMVLTGIRAPF